MAHQQNVNNWELCWDSLLIRREWCSVTCIGRGKSGSAQSFPPSSRAALVVHPHFSVSAWHAEQVPDCSAGNVFHILAFPSAHLSALAFGDLVLTDMLELGRYTGVI